MACGQLTVDDKGLIGAIFPHPHHCTQHCSSDEVIGTSHVIILYRTSLVLLYISVVVGLQRFCPPSVKRLNYVMRTLDCLKDLEKQLKMLNTEGVLPGWETHSYKTYGY